MMSSMAFNTEERDVTTFVYRAERYFVSLTGRRLALIGDWVARLGEAHAAELVGCDRQGERIVGAAAAKPGVRVVDTSRRLDGRRVVLVAGALAGPLGLEQTTTMLRSLGAAEVHCAWAAGWDGKITEADSSTRFNENALSQAAARQ